MRNNTKRLSHPLRTTNDIYTWTESVEVGTYITTIEVKDAVVTLVRTYTDVNNACGWDYGKHLIEEETLLVRSKLDLHTSRTSKCR